MRPPKHQSAVVVRQRVSQLRLQPTSQSQPRPHHEVSEQSAVTVATETIATIEETVATVVHAASATTEIAVHKTRPSQTNPSCTSVPMASHLLSGKLNLLNTKVVWVN